MNDRFDDTLTLPAVPAAPSPQAPKQPRRRRPWLRRIAIVTVVLLVVGWLGMWVALRQIPRIEGLGSLTADPMVGASTYLLVGSDSREDLPDDLEGSFGDFGGERSDVIILARPQGGSLHLLSLPRDLKVDIPGYGTDKINAAYAYGGADLLAATVAQATGVPVHHVVEIDFAGFAAVVDSLGGIPLGFPYAARDTKSGLEVEAGTTEVDGPTALAYARSRNYEELRDGSWVHVDADDIGRTSRQQEVLTAMMIKAASPAGVVRLPRVALSLDQAVRADAGLSVFDVLRAGWGMRGASVDAITLPVVFSNEGGISYVVPDQPAAQETIDRFLSGALLEAPAAE